MNYKREITENRWGLIILGVIITIMFVIILVGNLIQNNAQENFNDAIINQQNEDREDVGLALKEINKLSNRIWELENQNMTLLKYKAMAKEYKKQLNICFQNLEYLKEVNHD